MPTDSDGNAIYRVRGKEQETRQITVPAEIARMIPEGTKFRFQLTDRGFEYIRVEEARPRGLPAWLTGNDD